MTHTAAPLEIRFTPAHERDGLVAETFGSNAEANAILFAAAPALLEALEAILPFIVSTGPVAAMIAHDKADAAIEAAK